MKRLFSILAVLCLSITGCGSLPQPEKAQENAAQTEPVSALTLEYAKQFSAETYEDGCTAITIGSDRYLLVPEGMEPDAAHEEGAVVLRQPLHKIYLTATSAMDPICAIHGIKSVAFSGTDAAGWYIPEARAAMESGSIAYAGKYSAPNFEQLLGGGCDLSVQSTMILHKPEIKEQLEALGIPVLVERSSYETHPLGRVEWIKLYGLLLNKQEEAEAVFQKQAELARSMENQPPTGKTVAFFYITTNGTVSVRKSGDYIPAIIRMAGGEYVFQNLGKGEDALSTTTIQMEEFYAQARDADFLIYNGSIDDAMQTMEQFLAKSELLADFKAVRNGTVYCTDKNMFQQTTGLSLLMKDIHEMLTDDEFTDGEYVYKLN